MTREVNHLRRDLKKAHFARCLNEAGRNSRAMWRVLHGFIDKAGKSGPSGRTLFRDGAPVTGDSGIAEAFCDFFGRVGPDLASKVRRPASGSYGDYLGARSGSSVFFAPTTPGEVQLLCQGLDVNKEPGHDGVSPSVLRFFSAEIGTPLSRLINVCLEAGYFPDFLKIAKVTPVFKDGDPTQLGNYRPISVLPAISKIFERVIQGRLLSFLKRQGGFYLRWTIWFSTGSLNLHGYP